MTVAYDLFSFPAENIIACYLFLLIRKIVQLHDWYDKKFNVYVIIKKLVVKNLHYQKWTLFKYFREHYHHILYIIAKHFRYFLM